jgi:hypothetical protein
MENGSGEGYPAPHGIAQPPRPVHVEFVQDLQEVLENLFDYVSLWVVRGVALTVPDQVDGDDTVTMGEAGKKLPSPGFDGTGEAMDKEDRVSRTHRLYMEPKAIPQGHEHDLAQRSRC